MISQSFKKKIYKKYTSTLSYINFVPHPCPPQNPAQSTRGVAHSDDVRVSGAGERWGSHGFP